MISLKWIVCLDVKITGVSGTTTKGTITLLAQLTKGVHRKTTEELLGMPWRHFIALSVLYEQPVQSQRSLCEALFTDPTNCVLLLNEMESGGSVARRRDPADRRRHIVELTDTGRD